MREVLYVWNYREWGGVQIYFLSLIKEAKKHFKVTVLLPENSDPKILHYLDAFSVKYDFLHSGPAIEKPTGIWNRFSRRFIVMRSENRVVSTILSRPNIPNTIVHIDFGFWQSFLPLVRLCLKLNVFVTLHTALSTPNFIFWFFWKFKGTILSKFRRYHILASNDDAKNSLSPFISSPKLSDVRVTYAGFDPDELNRAGGNPCSRSDLCQIYGFDVNLPLVATVGQFIERKGCWTLLESLRLLKQENQNFTFLWLATTKPDSKTTTRIESFDLQDRFRLMAADEIGASRNDLLSLVGSIDLFVLASFQEGLPIALIEAMALGRACIATNVNAVSEAIEDGETGVLIAPGDSYVLATAIKLLLAEPLRRNALGLAAEKFAYLKFNEKITAAITLELYNSVWN